jgi:hypothetical protein
MKKGSLLGRIIVDENPIQRRNPMQKNNTEYPTLKELEQLVWRKLQETFSSVMTSVLEAYDEEIVQQRDKQNSLKPSLCFLKFSFCKTCSNFI